jgi:SAM-dependent methyltransferase
MDRVNIMRGLISTAGGPGTAAGWSELWRNQLTLWDLGKPTAAFRDEYLKAVASARVPTNGGRILIPGCGSGWDVDAIARTKYSPTVVGLDIAPEAIAVAQKHVASTPGATVVCGDFFKYPLEPVDLIFDYTFFCALPPRMRGDWGARTASLLKPGGRLLTLAFPLAPDEQAMDPDAPGPPFPVSESAYTQSLEPHGMVKEGAPYPNPLSVRENEMVIWWVKK